MTITLGSAAARPGEITYGEYDLIEHPLSGKDRLPVIIAQGRQAGPTFGSPPAFTAGAYRPAGDSPLITPELVRDLRGTLVSIPALSPTGLQMAQRGPYYYPRTPIACFRWHASREKALDPDRRRPRRWNRLLRSCSSRSRRRRICILTFTARPSFGLVCLSRPGAVSQGSARAKAKAERWTPAAEMCAAYGHSVVNEFPVEKIPGRKAAPFDDVRRGQPGAHPALTAELARANARSRHRARFGGGPAQRHAAGRNAAGRDGADRRIRVVAPAFLPPARLGACRSRVSASPVEPGTVKVGDPLVETRDAWAARWRGVLRSEYDAGSSAARTASSAIGRSDVFDGDSRRQ